MPTELKSLHYEGNLDRLLGKCSEDFNRVECEDRFKYKLEITKKDEAYSILFHYLGGCCIHPRPANYYNTVVTIKGPNEKIVSELYKTLEKELDIKFKEGPSNWKQMAETQEKISGLLKKFKELE